MLKYFNAHTHIIPHQKEEIAIVNLDARQNFTKVTSQLNSYGIHPWYLNEVNITSILEQIELNINNVDVIGEAGLDRFIDTDLELQKNVFIKQIHLSENHKKPMMIHCVRAYADLLQIRKQLNCKMPWIIHGFMGNTQIANQFINKGCYLSFGKVILQNRPKLAAVLQNTPSTYHLLETDDEKELTIQEVYQKASEQYNKPIEELQNEKIEIAKKLFSNINDLL